MMFFTTSAFAGHFCWCEWSRAFVTGVSSSRRKNTQIFVRFTRDCNINQKNNFGASWRMKNWHRYGIFFLQSFSFDIFLRKMRNARVVNHSVWLESHLFKFYKFNYWKNMHRSGGHVQTLLRTLEFTLF